MDGDGLIDEILDGVAACFGDGVLGDGPSSLAPGLSKFITRLR